MRRLLAVLPIALLFLFATGFIQGAAPKSAHQALKPSPKSVPTSDTATELPIHRISSTPI